MHTNQCQSRPRTDFSYVSTPSLISSLASTEVRLADGVSLADVVVSALADRGDADDIPALLDALPTCDPDLRGAVEDAIRDLHGGGRDRSIDRDWRLRYRMDPDYGFIDAGWPASAVGFTEDDGRRPRLAPAGLPVRTREAILAHPEPVYWRCGHRRLTVSPLTGLSHM
jgi:hypothetical protein